MELFGTSGVRGRVGDRITLERAAAVGTAAGQDGDRFVVGRDARTTGQALADALSAGLQRAGATVERIGVVPTPTVAWASQGRRAIVVTASHNPPDHNGLKCFVDGREYDRPAERRIERRLDEPPDGVDPLEYGSAHRRSVLEAYRDRLVEYARERVGPIEDLGVAVDCGTGTAGLVVPQVLDRLGADVLAVDANLDGTFPARQSRPTAESLERTRALIAERDHLDCGVAHDGDTDRTVLIDGAGAIVPADTVLAILAAHYLDGDGSVVVTTPNTSDRIDARARECGGRVERAPLGTLQSGLDANVAFAGEPWKHVHPPLGPWIDGVASAAVLCGLIDRDGLTALRDPIDERPTREVSIDCPEDRKPAAMERVTDRLPATIDHEAVDLTYGVRLDLPAGWVMVRPSGTEPVLRVYLEHPDADALLDRVREVVTDAVEST